MDTVTEYYEAQSNEIKETIRNSGLKSTVKIMLYEYANEKVKEALHNQSCCNCIHCDERTGCKAITQ